MIRQLLQPPLAPLDPAERERIGAQDLFVTQKTVENHLSSIYRKLDIKSRRELAAAIPEPGA